MAQHNDMSGMWTGLYRYNGYRNVIRFSAIIEDSGTTLSGSILEPNTITDTSAEELEAHLSGARSDFNFEFQKIYAASTGIIQPAVQYSGDVSSDFEAAHGIWNFGNLNGLSGTFQMSRVSVGAMDKVERRASLDT